MDRISIALGIKPPPIHKIYRIVKRGSLPTSYCPPGPNSPKEHYIVQRKIFWWWHTVHEGLFIPFFRTEEAAEKYINEGCKTAKKAKEQIVKIIEK